MTDEYSTNQPAHEEHAQPGANPVEDDFADPQASGEEAATVSQETESEEMPTEEMPAMTAGHSRSMVLPVLAGIGGVLFLGAVIYWQSGRFAHPPVPPMVMMAENSTKKNSPPASAIPSPSSLVAAPADSGDNDLDTLYKTAKESPSPIAAPTAPTTAMANMPESAAPGTPGSPAGVAAPGVPSSLPPASSATGSAETRIDALQKSLDQVTRQINQLTNMVAANQAMPTAGGAAAPSIEDRLNKIEQNLLELQHNQGIKAPAEVVAPAPVVPAATEKTAQHAGTHKKPKAAGHKAKAPAIGTTVVPHWVLRAATPNEAWVSAGATSSELRHLQVGDILPGIGRIRAIRQSGDSWVVEGTNGTVR